MYLTLSELTQDYISQVSEEIEGRVTKKLSKEFNKTESRILGALSKLEEFLLNPQVRACSCFRERLKTLTQKAGKFMGTAPQPILIPKGGIFLTTRDNSVVLRQTW